MKTLNTYYHNDKELESFITKNQITDSQSLLIQIFTASTDKEFIQNLLNTLNTLLPQAKILGSTTDGEISNGKVSTGQTVFSFTQFQNTDLELACLDHKENSYISGQEIAKTLVKKDTKLIIAFADGLHTNGELFLDGIHSVNKDIIVAGGMAGDNAAFNNTYVFTHEALTNCGAVAVALNSKPLQVNSYFSFGWEPIGIELTITKVENNRVYTIDDRTAVDTYAHYLGETAADSLPAIGSQFPIIIDRDGFLIARAVTVKHSDGSLTFAGNFKRGDKVRFGYGNKSTILENIPKTMRRIQENPSQALFIYSCMGRRRFMQEDIKYEINPLYNISPSCGFFTYGEFFTQKNKELLNQTMTILSLSENGEKSKEKQKAIKEVPSSNTTSINALANLINVTSNDFQKQKDAFEKLFSQSADAVCIIEDKKHINFNDGALKLLGLKDNKEHPLDHLYRFSPKL